MTVRRYGVLDDTGMKINVITADEKLIASDWYPGYGAKLIDEGEVLPDPLPAAPKPKPATWDEVMPKLAEPMENGDTIDFKTGEVTKKPLESAIGDEIAVEVVKL